MKSLPTTDDARVSVLDLACRDEVLKLLRALNDKFASARALAPYIERLPALMARIKREYHVQFMPTRDPSFADQLGALGNGALERILLQYLEDLTLFSAESAEAEGR